MIENRETITAVKVPSLIRPDQREYHEYSWKPGMTVRDVSSGYLADLQSRGYPNCVVQVNGFDAENLDAPVSPGDFVAISPLHGYEGIAAIAMVLIKVAVAVAVTAVSALIMRALAPSTDSSSSSDSETDSETHGFASSNATTSGNPVAVVHGNVMTTPQILNSYRRASSDYNMWIYVLLGLGAGETNHTPTADDVYLGEEPLSNYTDYTFGVTSGAVNPSAVDEAVLADKFGSIYHDRSFDRQLKYDASLVIDVAAQGTLGGVTAPSIGDTLTIGVETWTVVSSRSGPWQIAHTSDVDGSRVNIAYAINADSAIVTAAVDDLTPPFHDTVIVTANTTGAAGNTIAFSATGGSLVMDGDGFLGGTTWGLNGSPPESFFRLETNGQVDKVMMMITFPYGKFFMNGSTFDDLVVSMSYGYRELGSTGDITWSTQNLTGKGTQCIRKELWITFPSRSKYEIYLNRNTADDLEDESQQRSSSYLTSLTEELTIFQVYPGIQCMSIGVKASENLSGSLPVIRVVQNRTSITVPDWDGSGTQTVDPSIPAWSLYDAITNTHYGRSISATKILQSTWEDWEDWTEGLVDGNKRAQFHSVFDKPGNFSDNCIARIEESGRCRIVRIGDLWSVAIDGPKALTSYTFSRGNIARDSFQWEGFDLSEQIDAIQITYYDKDRHWNKKTVLAKASWYDTLTREPNVSSIETYSINNRDQAQREAIFRMQRIERTTRYGSLRSVKFRGAGLELLDKVDTIHRSIPFGFSGCLAGIPTSDTANATEEYAAATTIYLDQVINMPTADYSGKTSILIIDGDGVRNEFTVSGPFDIDTTSITISGGAFTGSRGDVWAIGRPNDDKLAYQIASKKLNSKHEIEFDIVEYDPSIFYHSDYGSGAVEI